jgi:hypothetical protein
VHLGPFGVRRVPRAAQVFHEPDSGAPRVPLLRCCLRADALPAGLQLKRYCPRPRPARFTKTSQYRHVRRLYSTRSARPPFVLTSSRAFEDTTVRSSTSRARRLNRPTSLTVPPVFSQRTDASVFVLL